MAIHYNAIEQRVSKNVVVSLRTRAVLFKDLNRKFIPTMRTFNFSTAMVTVQVQLDSLAIAAFTVLALSAIADERCRRIVRFRSPIR